MAQIVSLMVFLICTTVAIAENNICGLFFMCGYFFCLLVRAATEWWDRRKNPIAFYRSVK